MRLTELRDILNTLSVGISHYETLKEEYPYAIWGETGQSGSVFAGGKAAVQKITGFVEYYTKTEFDPVFDEIQSLLDGCLGLVWKLKDINFDYDTKVISYQWIWEFAGQVGWLHKTG